jgi:hypothetical protein
MIRICTISCLLLITMMPGCRKIPDRLITAEGQVLSGKLKSIDGRHIVFEDSEVSIGYEEARVFLRDGSGSYRGYISCNGGKLTVSTASGDREFSLSDIGSVIWSSPTDEETVTVDVSATDGWIDSGIEFSDDDRISIRATGSVSMETGVCGPSGIDYFSTSTALVPGATNGQLVMIIGESLPVAAGSTWTGDSPGSGELRLAVNIPDRGSTSGVGGTYVVTIVRTAGALNNSVLYPAAR